MTRDASGHATSVDPTDWQRSVVWLIVCTTAAWWLTRCIANANLDPYGDMLENFAWGQNLAWGTHKHPPLQAWLVGLWFKLVPVNQAMYWALSGLNAAVALAGMAALARAMGLSAAASFCVVALASLAFPYSTLAGKFNADTVLLSVWPWVVVAWRQATQTPGRRGAQWALGFGALAALGMLGKYYTGVLLLALAIASLSTPGTRAWLRGRGPWLAALAFALCLLPHVVWLWQHDWSAIRYVQHAHGAVGVQWEGLARFTASPIFYWLVPLLIVTVHAWRRGGFSLRRALGDRPVAWAAAMPWAITHAFGLSGFVALTTHWAIPIGLAYTVLMVRGFDEPQRVALGMRLRRAMPWFLALLPVLGLSTAIVDGRSGSSSHYMPREAAAHEVAARWHREHPGVALAWVAGQWPVDGALGFYAMHEVRTLPGMPDDLPSEPVASPGWQDQHGIIWCEIGWLPDAATRTPACETEALHWLQAHGIDPARAGQVVDVRRTDWLHPLPRSFRFKIWHVPPQAEVRPGDGPGAGKKGDPAAAQSLPTTR